MAKKWKLAKLYVAPEVSFATEPSANGSGYTFIKAFDATWAPNVDVIEREGLTGDLTRQSHTMGVKTGTLNFKVELKASGTPAASATAAIASEASPILLSALGTVVRGTGSTIASATTTVLTVADAAGFAKYMLIEVDGQQRFITSIAGSALTLDRALSGAPAGATVVYASSIFKKATTGHASIAFVGVRDDIQYTFLGCFAQVKVASVNAKGVATLDVTCQCGDWEVTSKASLPSTALTGITAVRAPVVKGAAFTVDGVEDVISSFEFDPGQTFVHQETTSATQAKQAIELTDAKPTGMFKPYYAAAHLTDFYAGTQKSLGMIVGTRLNGFGVYVPVAQYTGLALEDRSGLVGESISFAANGNSPDPEYVLAIF